MIHLKYVAYNRQSINSLTKFPGGAVVRNRCFHCWAPGSVPGQRSKIPKAMWCSQKKKKKVNFLRDV